MLDPKNATVANEEKPDIVDLAMAMQGGLSGENTQVEAPVEEDLLGVPLRIGGLPVRPPTLATLTFLKQINSPLIQGKDLNAVENVLLDIMHLVVLQTVPVKEAVQLVFKDRDGLLLRAMQLADTVSPDKIPAMIQEVVQLLQKSTATKVKAERPKMDSSAKAALTERIKPGNDSSLPG